MTSRKNIIINSGANFLYRFGLNLISFFTLPLFIRYYGDSKYALFILVNSVVESLVFFDFGVGTSLAKKSSEFTVNKDKGKYSIYFNWTFWFTALIATFFGALIFFFADNIATAFKVGPEVRDLAVMTFRMGAVYMVLYFILRIYQSILEGFEKFLIVNAFKTFQYVALIASALLVLYRSLDFRSYLIISILGNLVPFACYAIYFHSRTRVELTFRSGIKGLFRSDYWKMSSNFFVIQVTSFLFSLADKFIISFIIGATSVVYYSVVTKVAYIIRMVNNQTLAVISPVISRARESKDNELIGKIIREGAVYQFILLLPLITTSALFLRPFLRLWIGGDYVAYSHWGVLALVIYLIGPFSAMVQRVLIFGGHEAEVRNVTIWLVLSNVVISILLTYVLGIGGVIVGSVFQAVIAIPIFKRMAATLLDVHYRFINKDGVIGIITALVLVTVFFLFRVEGHIGSWMALLLIGSAFLGIQLVYPVLKLVKGGMAV